MSFFGVPVHTSRFVPRGKAFVFSGQDEAEAAVIVDVDGFNLLRRIAVDPDPAVRRIKLLYRLTQERLAGVDIRSSLLV